MRMRALIGPARAKMILMGGQKILADEALSFGLIDRIVDPVDLLDHAILMTDSAAATPEHCAGIKG